VLDRATLAKTNDRTPEVGFDGTNFVVLWHGNASMTPAENSEGAALAWESCVGWRGRLCVRAQGMARGW
jgi:hypothetical protein